MKRYFLSTSLILLLSFFQITNAQTSVLNEGYYFPLNGSYPNLPAIDDYCSSWSTNTAQPCNRGTIDEAGVDNAAYLFRGNTNGKRLERYPLPGNYFPYIYSYNNYNNGLTIAFSFKLTKAGDPTANTYDLGGTVIDGTYEDGFIGNIYNYNNSDPIVTRGFSINAGIEGVTFDCYFGTNNIYTDWQRVTSGGINGSISPFVPDTGVWYHAICKVIQEPNNNGGYTTMQIFINGNLKGQTDLTYRPFLSGYSPSIGASVRPNNAAFNPCYSISGCNYPIFNSNNTYNAINNNPYLINNTFIGALDELRIYNKTVSSSEQQEIYNARLNSPVPAIRSFSPTSIRAGAQMLITGNNFNQTVGARNQNLSVLINGTSADSINIISDDSIRVKVANPNNNPDSTILVRSVRVTNSSGEAVRYGIVSASTTTTPIPPRPGIIITGPSSACGLVGTDSVVTYRVTDTLPTTYLWKVSNSNMVVLGGLTADTLRVKFKSSFTSGVIYVKRMRVGDTTNLTLTVTSTTPSRPYSILGNKNICNNIGTGAGTPSRYYVRRAVGASEYVWTLPAGVSIQGVSNGGSMYSSSDTAINLVFTSGFTSGTLLLKTQNQCGSSTEISISLAPVNVAVPGAISGATDVCASMISDSLPSGNPITYTVRRNSAYTGYVWTVPNHVNILDYPGGFGTINDTAITVIIDSSFVSGNISVQGVTPCFTTAPRNLAITRRLPSYRLISILSSTLTCPTRSIQYKLTLPIQYARWYEWSLPTNATIDGRNDTTQITANFTTAASITGDRVRVRGINNCGKGIWAFIPVKLPACSTSFAKGFTKELIPNKRLNATVYPNPTKSAFNLQWTNNVVSPIYIQVTDIAGKHIESLKANNLNSISFGQNYTPGIYIVQIKQGTDVQMLRVVKY